MLNEWLAHANTCRIKKLFVDIYMNEMQTRKNPRLFFIFGFVVRLVCIVDNCILIQPRQIYPQILSFFVQNPEFSVALQILHALRQPIITFQNSAYCKLFR